MRKARILGIAISLAGLVVVVGFFFISEDFTPELGLSWNLRHMEVVVSEEVVDSYMDIKTFREKYPIYNDLDDSELARRIHAKYFRDLTAEEYRKVFLASGPTTPPAPERTGDTLNIRGDFDDIRTTDPLTGAIMTQDAIDFGLFSTEYRKVSFPYRDALVLGGALIAIGALIAVVPAGRRKGY